MSRVRFSLVPPDAEGKLRKLYLNSIHHKPLFYGGKIFWFILRWPTGPGVYLLKSHSGRLERSCKPSRKPRRFESDLELQCSIVLATQRIRLRQFYFGDLLRPVIRLDCTLPTQLRLSSGIKRTTAARRKLCVPRGFSSTLSKAKSGINCIFI